MASPLLPALLALLAFLSRAQLALARDECYGPIVELKVFSPQPAAGSQQQLQPSPALLQYGVLAYVGSNLSQPLNGLRIVAAEPPTACGAVAPAPPGSALLVVRGNCTFTDKALAVQAAGAAAMLLYDNAPGCITMAFDPNTTAAISPSLALVSIPHDVGNRLAAMAAGSTPAPAAAAAAADPAGAGGAAAAGGLILSLRLVDNPLVDAGAALLWLMAVGTVAAGAVWSGADHLAARRAGTEDQDPLLRGSASKGGSEGGGSEVLDLTPRAALGFVVMASAMLLLMYFFLNRVFFFVLLGLFCLASIQSQTVLYSAGLQAALPGRYRQATVKLPLAGPCPLAAVAALPVATAVAVVWAVCRNAPWAWLLQDLQGVCLMLLVLRSLRVTSLKVAAVLLPTCLAYDVFWVFVQPMLFGGGESVMVQVAQGGSSGEYVPMLLRVPHFGFGGLGGFSLLGFGDVILPGMLVAFTRRMDLDLGITWRCGGGGGSCLSYLYRSYFPYTVLSYGAGLCLTYAALAFSWFGDQGQPALLYLVPCTLLAVAGLAAARRQLGVLWRGPTHGSVLQRRPPTDHDSDAGDASVSAATEAMEAGAAVGAGVGFVRLAGASGGGGAGLEGGGDVEAPGPGGLGFGLRPGVGGPGEGGAGVGGGRSRRGGDAA